MKDEILDENLISNEGNNVRPKLVNWISLIILWFGIGLYLSNGMLSDIQAVAGAILLSISTITTYFKYRIGIKITSASILLGIFGVVKYFPISYSIVFGKGNFGLGFEMLILLIGVIHYFTNKEVLSSFLSRIINREIPKEEMQATERILINGFKNRFSKKSIEELRVIAKNEILLPEAIQAAKELIEKRETE